MKSLNLIFIIILLSGCATTRYTYFKPHIDQAQADRDTYECKQQSYAGSMDSIFIAMEFYDQCMRSRGYVKN